MKLNWLGYWNQSDGYGRFNTRLIRALQRAGCDVRAVHISELDRPPWLLAQLRLDWSHLTLSCMPPFMLQRVPGRHWLYTMTEGSLIPPEWVERIHRSGVERVLVPCQHNVEAFRQSGVEVPISVVPGGTDPNEFPLVQHAPKRPYTFLTLADRNQRKGWHEVWEAFYRAFGGKTTGDQDVRLIVKSVPTGNNVTEVIAQGQNLDRRIIWQIERAPNMATVYAQADCVVLPSRSEGWGLPHREAASMGLPVIVQAYAGLDDGYTHEWAIVVDGGQMQPIPREQAHCLGEWRVVDVQELVAAMRACYERPEQARAHGLRAAQWLRQNQTWAHSAQHLIELVRQSNAVSQPLRAA